MLLLPARTLEWNPIELVWNILAQRLGVFSLHLIKNMRSHSLVQASEIFGPLLNGHRQNKRLFRDKTNIQLLCCIYYNTSLGTLGGVYSSTALLLAYKEKLLAVCENKIQDMKRERLLGFDETPHSQQFFRVIDNMCG